MSFLALALLFVPQLCIAAHLSCNATQRDNQMTYSINQDNRLNDNLTNCSYSWSNASTVIANYLNKLPLVTRNGLYTLETSTCVPNIDWEAHCTKTTGFLTSFKSNCTTTCIKDGVISGDNGYSTTWLAVGIILAALVLAGLAFICYKCKKKDDRDQTCGCTQFGGRYMNVKVPPTDLPDV